MASKCSRIDFPAIVIPSSKIAFVSYIVNVFPSIALEWKVLFTRKSFLKLFTSSLGSGRCTCTFSFNCVNSPKIACILPCIRYHLLFLYYLLKYKCYFHLPFVSRHFFFDRYTKFSVTSSIPLLIHEPRTCSPILSYLSNCKITFV